MVIGIGHKAHIAIAVHPSAAVAGVAYRADAEHLAISQGIDIAVVSQQRSGGKQQAYIFIGRGRFAHRHRCVIDGGHFNPGGGAAAQTILVGDGVAKAGCAVEIGVGYEKHLAADELYAAMRRVVYCGDGEGGQIGVCNRVGRLGVGQQCCGA